MDKLKELVAQIVEQIKTHGANQWTEEQLATLFTDDFYDSVDNEVQTQITAEKQKLVEKNNQLIGEKRKLQKQLSDTSQVDVEKYENQIEQLTSKQEELNTEIQRQKATAEAQSASLQKELKKSAGLYTVEKEHVNNLLKQRALSTGLGAMQINPELRAALEALMEKKVMLVEDPASPEGRKAVFEMTGEDGKTIQKPFEEYLKTDWAPKEGKNFILSAATGGAPGQSTSKDKGTPAPTGSDNPFGDLKFSDGSGNTL
jgi:hypothetical protein